MFNKHFLFAVVLLVVGAGVYAQNNTNSPYTRFGYGELVDTYSAEQRAMGGVAIAGRNNLGINTVNPASYSSVDSLTFMFDVGLSGLISRFSDPQGVNSKFTSNLEYITMQFPLSRSLAMSAGLLPFSFSGYSFYRNDSLPVYGHQNSGNKVYYQQSFSGNGGITQVYTGLSLKLLRHFSLGVNAYYMFGDVSNKRATLFSSGGTSAEQDNFIHVGSYRFRYGLQYFRTFASKHTLQAGLIYENKSVLKSEARQINSGIPSDTLLFGDAFDMPVMFGAGLNYTFDEKLTLAVDYVQQQWSDSRFYNKTDSLTNRTRLSIGAEYIPDIRGRSYFDRVRYRAGLTLSDPYYKIAGQQQSRNYGISFGVGLPLRTSNTMINVAVEYGKTGERSMFREDYFKFTLNTTFSENWFFKRKL
ncbi:MAG: hypothetical protein LWW91_07130 [Bacteroidales bacterium]|nr:hypothetical protein [Bacteroidales bacterium]